MHDIRAIRQNPDVYDRGWALKGLESQAAAILKLDTRLREVQTALQTIQARRNETSKRIGQAKAAKDDVTTQVLLKDVEDLKEMLGRYSVEESQLGTQLQNLLAGLPNIPGDDVPPGADDGGNVIRSTWGEPRRLNNPKDHVDLGAPLGMDFESAARMSGARFVLLKGQIARLERALGQFMLDLQTVDHGYTEVNPPLLVRDQALFGTGQLPKFEGDLFFSSRYMSFSDEEVVENVEGLFIPPYVSMSVDPKSNDIVRLTSEQVIPLERRRWLIPTAEVSLTNTVREQLLDETELPLRLTALTPCFRAEAGAAGKDTRGMIRQHQFNKVELVSITTPEASNDEHERMTGCAEAVLQKLGLAYRVMLLCAGDMGFGARKTYDLEVWLPSQNTYREISSCSNCGDFQARRMDARFRRAGEKGTQFVHTLNGSGLAVGRTLVAVLENYQDEGGRIAIPDVLVPYMGGVTHLDPAG